MAKIIVEGQEKEIDDGSEIKDACEYLDIPFGCRQGNCGTCTLQIIEGKENLSEKSDKENDMSLEQEDRLACQCKINGGTIVIKSRLFS